MLIALTAVLLTLPILVAVLVASALSRRLSRRAAADVVEHPQFGVIQGALLALLGLLLGFGFSGAMNRFVDRQDILVREANAISTTYLRTDLVAEPRRSELRATLREYTQQRHDLFLATEPADALHTRLEATQGRLWSAVVAIVKEEPALATPLLNPMNEMFDLLSTRNAANQRHIPVPVLAIIYLCALASAFSVGFGLRHADKRVCLAAVCLAVLIATTLWITFDLDFPRAGLIRISNKPLADLMGSMSTKGPR